MAFPRLLALGLAVLWAWSASGSAAAADCRLRVGWDEWPPYISEQGGRLQGPEYELLTSTADAAGCKLEWLQIPWARALKMLAEGDLDLLYGAGYSDERAKFAKFSAPYRIERFVLMTRSTFGGDPDALSLAEWIDAGPKPREIGVFRGDVYGDNADRILKTAKNAILIELNDNDQLIGMLKAGRLDGYVIEDQVAALQLKDAVVPLHRYAIKEQAGDPLHYMFALQVGDDVVARFNAAIRKRLAESR